MSQFHSSRSWHRIFYLNEQQRTRLKIAEKFIASMSGQHRRERQRCGRLRPGTRSGFHQSIFLFINFNQPITSNRAGPSEHLRAACSLRRPLWSVLLSRTGYLMTIMGRSRASSPTLAGSFIVDSQPFVTEVCARAPTNLKGRGIGRGWSRVVNQRLCFVFESRDVWKAEMISITLRAM